MSLVKGVKQTTRAMRGMREIQRPVSEASRDALKPMLRDTKQNLVANDSVKRGVLRKGMKIRQRKKTKERLQMVIAATGKAVSIAHLVEFGTEPHFQPKRGIMHPGAKPHPFLTPAFVSNEASSLVIFGKVIGPRIEQQARRLARK